MGTQDLQTWLEGLKPGDTVVCEYGQGYTVEYLDKVVSTTATLIRVSVPSATAHTDEYRRKDGRMRGGTWDQCIRPPTQGARERIERKRLIPKIEATNWSALSLETLRQVADLVRPKAGP